MKIDLMEHHIPFVVDYFGKSLKDLSFFEKMAYNLYYGKASLIKGLNWVNTFNLKETKIIIRPDFRSSKKINVDSLCRSIDCVYHDSCSRDLALTDKKMFWKNPLFYPFVIYSAMKNSQHSIRDKGLCFWEQYSFEEILNAYK